MQWCHVQSEQCLQNIVWRVFFGAILLNFEHVCVFCWISRLPPSNPSKRDGCVVNLQEVQVERLYIFVPMWQQQLGSFCSVFFQNLVDTLINIAGFMWGLMKFAYRLYDYVVLYTRLYTNPLVNLWNYMVQLVQRWMIRDPVGWAQNDWQNRGILGKGTDEITICHPDSWHGREERNQVQWMLVFYFEASL